MKLNGFFLTIEGLDGSGKGTVISGITKYLEDINREYTLTKEPGADSSFVCRKIREIVLDPKSNVNFGSEFFLYLADRAQHVEEIIKPSLSLGKIVVCDRYIDSMYAYQGWGRNYGDKKYLDKIVFLNNIATKNLVPDLTIILFVDPEIGLNRIKNNSLNLEFGEHYDRIEKEKIDFHKRVYLGYEDIVKKSSYNGRKIYALNTSYLSKADMVDSVVDYIKFLKKGETKL